MLSKICLYGMKNAAYDGWWAVSKCTGAKRNLAIDKLWLKEAFSFYVTQNWSNRLGQTKHSKKAE